MAQNWIKSWGYGARGRRIRDDWRNESHGLLMNAITFGAKRRPRLGSGDGVIYYAAGWQLLFAAGTVTSYAYWFESDGHTSWPWRVNVQLEDDCTREFIHAGVPLDVLNVDGGTSETS